MSLPSIPEVSCFAGALDFVGWHGLVWIMPNRFMIFLAGVGMSGLSIAISKGKRRDIGA